MIECQFESLKVVDMTTTPTGQCVEEAIAFQPREHEERALHAASHEALRTAFHNAKSIELSQGVRGCYGSGSS